MKLIYETPKKFIKILQKYKNINPFTINTKTAPLLTDINQIHKIIMAGNEELAGISLIEFSTYPHAN
jgi:hypothetical protein